MKVLLMVIDGLGVGEAPDAYKYKDEGSNTFLNTYRQHKMIIPNFRKMGLTSIEGLNLEKEKKVVANFARLAPLSAGKDTTTGHLELSGVVLDSPYPTFPLGIPDKVIRLIEKTLGTSVLGKQAVSGTKVLEDLGELHLKTGKPIVYTSADSVIQIATHEKVYSIKELYQMCKKIRELMQGPLGVGRVIARPFSGEDKNSFYRLPFRKDFALDPPKPTMLNILKENKLEVIGVGKIRDIFNSNGIGLNIDAKNNTEAIQGIKQAIAYNTRGLIFANLIDTDMLYGHRNNPQGFAKALEEIDSALPEIINLLNPEDIIIIVGDHGNDPTTVSTDHSREYVPMLVYGKTLKKGVNLGTLQGFNQVAKLILEAFGLAQNSVLSKIKN